MLQVEDSMTRGVVTVPPGTSAGEALALCRERRIRHLPVLDGGVLVGIVSDRDLRAATPAFGDPARAAALAETKIEDVMTREVVTTLPDDPIDGAANEMRERGINCLPVLRDGELAGILTSSDVMEALVHLLGAHEPGSRMEVVVPDRPGTLAGVAGIIGELGVNIVSVVTGPRQEGSPPTRVAVFRVDTINPAGAAEVLDRAGYTILWPPAGVSGRAAIVHDEALESYGFGEGHPFNPLRLRLTLELCEDLGLLDGYSPAPSGPASDGDLTTVHSLTYVRMVQEAGRGAALSDLLPYGLGTSDNPLFPDMHGACARVVGGVLEACRLVMRGEAAHAMCISGGLHHALRSQASGFCVYNDAGAAIARLKEEHPGLRVAYVDTDAHHGDGVQWMFYDDPDVLTVSLHESGRHLFPGTGDAGETGRGEGTGYAVNVPLQPFTDDASFEACFEAVVPDALRAFGPDLILSQNGCDAHKLDPLTHLSATTRLYEHVPRRMHDLAHELCGGRWVATGGGGYDIWRVVPRAWATLWAAVSHQETPKDLPAGWLARWGPESPVALPRSMRDDPADYPPVARAPEIADRNRRTAEAVLENVMPRIS